MLSHTRSCTCRMLEVTHTSPTSPSPQMDRSKSMSADYKTATGPFHFCLDKVVVLNDFSSSAFILDQTASVWRNESYSCCCSLFSFDLVLFLSSTRTKLTTSNEESNETAEKTIKTTSYIAKEAKICNKTEFDYSL